MGQIACAGFLLGFLLTIGIALMIGLLLFQATGSSALGAFTGITSFLVMWFAIGWLRNR